MYGGYTSSECAVVLGMLRQAGPSICSFRVACIHHNAKPQYIMVLTQHLLFVIHLDNLDRQTFYSTVAASLMMLHADRYGEMHHEHAGSACHVHMQALGTSTLWIEAYCKCLNGLIQHLHDAHMHKAGQLLEGQAEQ